MSEQTYTGRYGIVLLLDEKLWDAAKEINAQFQEGNSIDLSNGQIPHITLYHSTFKDLPHEVVVKVLDDIKAKLPLSVYLREVKDYGGKFLFWLTNSFYRGRLLHTLALLLKNFYDDSFTPTTAKEDLSLSAEEFDNVKNYGHPLVKRLWLPHVTVGYFPDGVVSQSYIKSVSGTIPSVAFVSIGEFGMISDVIILR